MIKSVASMQNGKTTKNEKIKMCIGILVGIGADAVVSAILKQHVPVAKGWRKALMALGSFVLAMKVGEDCENYFHKVWDETSDALKEAKTELEKTSEEEEVEPNAAG